MNQYWGGRRVAAVVIKMTCNSGGRSSGPICRYPTGLNVFKALLEYEAGIKFPLCLQRVRRGEDNHLAFS